jgi:S1-C subfamily serine protease
MTLPETFESIRPSIVAFISRMVPGKAGSKPLFPPVFGTGFFIDSRGIVLTNRHVVDIFKQIPHNPTTKRSAAAAIVFLAAQTEGGYDAMGTVFADVRGWWVAEGFWSKSEWYGEDDPDLAFVQLDITDTPAVQIASGPGLLKAGLSVATAGFPLGNIPMTMFNKVTQLGPLLRRGIVSSVFPFAGRLPHGFTLDVMIQGGASGSPVFLENEPMVVGMIGASLTDQGANTNISIGLPGHVLSAALNTFIEAVPIATDGVPTLRSMVPADSEIHSSMNWDEYTILPHLE